MARSGRNKILLYVVFLVLVGLCAAAVVLLVVGPNRSGDSRPTQQASPQSPTVAPVAVETNDGADARTFWKGIVARLKKGEAASVWKLCVKPKDVQPRDRALERLEADAAAMAKGALTLETIGVRSSGDWAMIAILRKQHGSRVEVQTLRREEGQWLIVPEHAFGNPLIAQRIDDSYDALAAWSASKMSQWEKEHIVEVHDPTPQIGARTADATAMTPDEPQATVQPEDDTTSDISAGDAWLAALTAANLGDYADANKLVDVGRLAAPDNDKPGPQDLIDYWDTLTRERSFREGSLKVRRAKTDGEKVNVMLRARLEDGNSWTVKVDLQRGDGRWLLVKVY